RSLRRAVGAVVLDEQVEANPLAVGHLRYLVVARADQRLESESDAGRRAARAGTAGECADDPRNDQYKRRSVATRILQPLHALSSLSPGGGPQLPIKTLRCPHPLCPAVAVVRVR